MPPKRNNRKRYNRVNKRRKGKRQTPLALKPHNFCERFEQEIRLDNSTITSLGNLGLTTVKKFRFDDIPQHPQYALLFDEYKINKVVATFRWSPSRAIYALGGIQNLVSPMLIFKVDHNDDTQDAIADLKKSMKTHYKRLKYDEDFTIQLKPASQVLVDANIGNTYTPTWNRYITTDVLDVEHLGLKMQVQVPQQTGSTSNLDLGSIE